MKTALTLALVLLLCVAAVIGRAAFLVVAVEGLTDDTGPSPLMLGMDIPGQQWVLYGDAADRYDLPEDLLAAVAKVGCEHGRADSCTRLAGADTDGVSGAWTASVEDPWLDVTTVDGIGARLAASDAAGDPLGALTAVGFTADQRAMVVSWAVAYGWIPEDPERVLRQAVLDHPNIELHPTARADVEHGVADWRVLNALLVMATSHRLSFVGPIRGGHSRFVEGTDRESNHYDGRAVDIPVVDGQRVDDENEAARHAVELVLHNTLGGATRPDEIGAPWPYRVRYGDRSFTDRHDDHLHFGWDV